MKVYAKVVVDINTGKILEEDFFMYWGPIAECKGGSRSTSTTVDYAYNARMAAIAEKNQVYADQMFHVFKYGTKETGRISEMDLMSKQIQTEYGLLPQKTDTEREGLKFKEQLAQAGQELIPLQTEAEKVGLKDRMKTTRERAPVISSFYEDAMTGVDVDERVGQARSGVHQSFQQSEEITKRNMSRLGVDPSSGAAASAFKDVGIHKATALAGAGTAAKTQAEAEDFNRKRQALGLGI